MKIFNPLTLLAALLAGLSAAPLSAAELGMTAPPLAVREWVKGTKTDLAAGKGKNIYVIEFWATWCGPCRESIPHLSQMQKELKDKGVVFIGVSNEEAAEVKPFVKKMGSKMDYPVAVDEDGKTTKAYMEAFGIDGIPHAFVVDKNGQIAWQGHPMTGLERTLTLMLAGKYDVESGKRAKAAEKLFDEYFDLVTEKELSPKAKTLGEQILKDGAGNPHLIESFAWTILTHETVIHRDLPLALRAAKMAVDTYDGKNADTLDTYARALFDNGRVAEAIQTEKKAISLSDEPDEKAEMKKRLVEYEKQPKK